MFNATNNAQVIIKEKVEIKPQSTISAYQVPAYTPCGPWITSYDRLNPWQVVWNQISFSPDPYQQMFNFQDNRYGPGLQRRTYTIDPNKYYNITLLQPDEYSYFTYGGFTDNTTGNFVPIQYVGTTINGVLGADLGAIAWFDYVRDYPNGLYHSYSNKYNLKIKRDIPPGTEIIMSVFDGQETINYHTRVETPTFAIENDTNEDTLYHNQSRDIEFLLNFQNPGNCQLGDYGGAYPTGIKFNVEIVQGQQYGNLYYPGTVADPEQSGSSITNLEDEYGQQVSIYSIRYTADGVQPDTSTPAIVTIRCTANDADIAPAEVSFPIKYSNEPPPSVGGYILVDFNKDSFSPGDTAITNCKWLTSYNEIIDFPGDQSFNAEIISGKEYGTLLDPNTGTVADNLQGVSNGFKVITAASIPYDSVVIRIRVNTMVNGGGIIAAKIVNNKTQNSKTDQSKETEINKSINSMLSTLSIGNPGMLIEGFGDVVVKKDGDWCDSLIICNSSEYLPNVILNQVPNGYSGHDICTPNIGQLEGVNAFWTDTLYSFELSLCYNDQRQKLWFNITDNHTLKINYSYAICENNLPPGKNCQLINDWTEMSNSLNCDEYEAILHATYFYGNHAAPCYYFRNVIYAHEMEHIKDYQSAIDEAKISFYEGLDSINVTCSNFENPDSARNFFERNLIDRFDNYNLSGKEIFRRIQKEGETRSGTYEQDVQNRHSVRAIINNQIDALNVAYGCSIPHLYE